LIEDDPDIGAMGKTRLLTIAGRGPELR